MTRRALLNAADLLRTAAALQVQDPALLQRLARQLGLAAPPGQLDAPAVVADAQAAVVPRRPPRNRPEPPPTRPPVRDAGTGRDDDAAAPGSRVAALLTPLPDLAGIATTPAWRAPGAAQMAKGPVVPPTPHDSLFSPASSRAMGGALAAVRVADGDVDADRLVAALAGGQPLRQVPRLPVWTLRHGLQVLVDQGPAMQPWQTDVEQLLAQLERLLGEAQLQVLGFDGAPLRRCRHPDTGDAMRWPLPPPGAAVLLVTDLGITHLPGRSRPAAPAAARHWQGFAHAAAQAGVAVRVLVPQAPARWPAGLPAPLRPLWWDRRTTVAAVRRLLAA